jgi:hypothetical protein
MRAKAVCGAIHRHVSKNLVDIATNAVATPLSPARSIVARPRKAVAILGRIVVVRGRTARTWRRASALRWA